MNTYSYTATSRPDLQNLCYMARVASMNRNPANRNQLEQYKFQVFADPSIDIYEKMMVLRQINEAIVAIDHQLAYEKRLNYIPTPFDELKAWQS